MKPERRSFQKKKDSCDALLRLLSFSFTLNSAKVMMLTLFPRTVSESAVALANPSLIGTGGLVSPFRQRRDGHVWGRAKLAA